MNVKERIERAAEPYSLSLPERSVFTIGAVAGFRLAIEALRERAKEMYSEQFGLSASFVDETADYLESLLEEPRVHKDLEVFTEAVKTKPLKNTENT